MCQCSQIVTSIETDLTSAWTGAPTASLSRSIASSRHLCEQQQTADRDLDDDVVEPGVCVKRRDVAAQDVVQAQPLGGPHREDHFAGRDADHDYVPTCTPARSEASNWPPSNASSMSPWSVARR